MRALHDGGADAWAEGGQGGTAGPSAMLFYSLAAHCTTCHIALMFFRQILAADARKPSWSGEQYNPGISYDTQTPLLGSSADNYCELLDGHTPANTPTPYLEPLAEPLLDPYLLIQGNEGFGGPPSSSAMSMSSSNKQFIREKYSN